VTVGKSQTVHVAFAPSLAGYNTSVYIAGAQFEAVPSTLAPPTTYQHTGANRFMAETPCRHLDGAFLRQAFERRCDPAQGCYYQLKSPIMLSTEALQFGVDELKNRIAAGNYNYRHVSLGLNLVGTSVVDCGGAPGPACYANGFIEYTLAHDAFQVPVLNALGQNAVFSFGEGAINHGKALAAEKYITLPIASADQALLSQPAFTKVELRGRPLDGSYSLRIWDTPSLHWDHLEDVQVVLGYRYWSQVKTQQDGAGP